MLTTLTPFLSSPLPPSSYSSCTSTQHYRPKPRLLPPPPTPPPVPGYRKANYTIPRGPNLSRNGRACDEGSDPVWGWRTAGEREMNALGKKLQSLFIFFFFLLHIYFLRGGGEIWWREDNYDEIYADEGERPRVMAVINILHVFMSDFFFGGLVYGGAAWCLACVLQYSRRGLSTEAREYTTADCY